MNPAAQTNADAPAIDPGSRRVALVYAEALSNSAEKLGQTDAVGEEFDSLINDVFKAQSSLEVLFSSAAAGRYTRADLIRKVFEGRSSDTFVNFLLVLNDHERLELLRPIRDAYEEISNRKHRRLPVLVQSAAPLPDDQRQSIVEKLRQTFQQKPILTERVDPAMLGGIKLKVGDWLYDGSLLTRIETIRNQILERSSHEIQSRRDRFSSDTGN